jgi:two-component system, NarL family, sensor kinase
MPRVPLDSPRPIVWLAAIRIAIVSVVLAALAAFEVPNRNELIVLAAAAAAPLSLGVLFLAYRRPAIAVHPGIALIDLLILAVAEAISPETYGAVRFLALFLIAAHAHFQGTARGVAIAIAAVILLLPLTGQGDAPVSGDLLAFYETVFAAAAIAAGLFIGRLRTAESVGRMRARELSRRVIEAESQVRRRLAEAIHDGPVQALVSLDMILDAARRALERGDEHRATELLEEARNVSEQNVGALREEIVSLGPYALDDLTLDAAIEQCAGAWSRRYGMQVRLDLDSVDLPNEQCGSLFGIVSEAVSNAGRHSGGSEIVVSLSQEDGVVEVCVSDDGRGFDDQNPFSIEEPGHIGLATMRERAELAGAELRIDSGEDGTTVIARARVGAHGNGSGWS